MIIIKKFTFAVIAFCFTFALCGCNEEYRKAEGMVWNTTFHVTYRNSHDLTDSIYSTLSEVGSSLNVFDDSSLISKANKRDTTIINDDFKRVYDMSVEINRESGGAFDPTLGPLIDAWGFGRGHHATSDTLQIDSLLGITGIARTRIEGNILIKQNPHIRFNFSAIAKGYGCDRIAEMLERNGSTDFIVEIGGEIRCSGKNPTEEKWRVSIDKPIVTDSIRHDSQCVISVTDAGIATSGNYRNFHKNGNAVYGHTISSSTGRPIQTDVVSVTVVSSTAMEADALATAMMAMGSNKSMALAKQRKIPVLLILANGDTWQSEEFAGLVSQ